MPLRIATFVGAFPVISETFILNQITGLLDLGHDVDVFADLRTSAQAPLQPDIAKYGLLPRTTFMDLPEECHPWELPVRPIAGQTWVPGADRPISNFGRVGRALPILASCYLHAPRLTRQVLDRAQYGYCAESLSSIYRLAKLADIDKTYDIVHAHFGPVANRFRFVKDLWNVPLVATFYGYDFSVVPRKEGPATYEKLFRSVDRVIAISDYVAGQLEKLGCPASKIAVIRLGIDTRNFPFMERTFTAGAPTTLLTVARLVEKKGLEYGLRAFAEVHRRFPSCRYEIIGDGPLRQTLEKLAAQLGLRESVHFHGAQDAAFIRAKMAEAHLFVLASVTAADGDQEGQGLVLTEAQATGLPVVATAHAALPETIAPGNSGFLVPERDPDALAAKIVDVLSAPESWPAIGHAGRRFVEQKFELSTLNRKLETLYLDVISSGHA